MAKYLNRGLTYPYGVLLEVTSLIPDAIGMAQPAQKTNLFKDVLPLFQRLLAGVTHLFDGHHLCGDIVSGVVYGAETAVADLAQVIEESLGVLAFKELGHLRVLETPRPRERLSKISSGCLNKTRASCQSHNIRATWPWADTRVGECSSFH